ncbi:uncharacterized protein LOC143026293 isoform X2 [Oratosquilla oratoria]|uniref:uncharacterized protein LOC143026293 isoform X2 n=1 Tax=Oratosquilla oratoria TaxID=337810 RepID=UPI003F762474
MGISEKEAFRILGLPLGVDKDAIHTKFKQLSTKYSASKSAEDRKKLEQVKAAYLQLLPPPITAATNIRSSNTITSAHSGHSHLGFSNGNISFNSGNLSEVDKDKKKAEKRKAKKKRRKERKKLEKLENQNVNYRLLDGMNRGMENSGWDGDEEEEEDEDDEDEEEGIDPTSAFVAKAAAGKRIGAMGTSAKVEDKSKGLTKGSSQEDDDDINSGIEPMVLQSRQLAIRGNEAANMGQYKVAVRLFSDAIQLDPSDYRFFGNRSYCYDQMELHEKALQDAEKAISISPLWPKGYFRKGRALRGLGRWIDAESAFEHVLRLDRRCEEAQQEITKVRIIRIKEMGFSDHQAKAAIKRHIFVQPALDALLAGHFNDHMDDVFFSDEDDDLFEPAGAFRPQQDVKMNPRNPEGLTSLWVGNVLPEVTEKVLTQLFSKYGAVTSVRLLKEKYCAFINYADKICAGRAMEGLQGAELCGHKLLIKFPDNPIGNGNHSTIIRKNKLPITKVPSIPPPPTILAAPKPVVSLPTTITSLAPVTQITAAAGAVGGSNGNKLRGPVNTVNGDECYFWRTTGCAFGESCKHKHIKKNKGIDRKPWQK